jgi:predicted metal-dependent hydrolase
MALGPEYTQVERPLIEQLKGLGWTHLEGASPGMVTPSDPVKSGRTESVRHLVAWYRKAGEQWLRKRVAPWAQRMSTEVTGLRVLPLGYRWGSCAADGKVNVHWATMQLPPDLIDYVLVHELVHVRHPDHGADFWRSVDRAMPGYEARRARLKRAGPDLWLPG